MIEQATYTYGGMLKDLSKSKFPNEKYYDAKNIRILSTGEESTLSVTTEKGNVLKFTLPTYSYYSNVYEPILLHSINVVNYIVSFVYYKTDVQSIIRINVDTNEIVTLIQGNLGVTETCNIESESFYENEELIKIYWADGINQLRYLNIMKPTSNITLLDVCPSFNVSVPELESITYGGIHTAGMIQYCYNLIVKNGAQTKCSPRSELIPLKKQVGGVDVNELVGQINHIKIDNVDTKFDIVRVYSIKYTSYNQSPVISLIAEESIDKSARLTTIRVVDDGRVISNLSEKELLFLGGENMVPKCIASKFNYLILGDITEKFFDVDSSVYDTRAYRFKDNTKADWSTSKIKNSDKEYENIIFNNSNQLVLQATGTTVPLTHDCINDEVEFAGYSVSKINKVYTPDYLQAVVGVPVLEGDSYYCNFDIASELGTDKVRLTYDLELYCPDDNNIIYLNEETYPDFNFKFEYDLATISDISKAITTDLNNIVNSFKTTINILNYYAFYVYEQEGTGNGMLHKKLVWTNLNNNKGTQFGVDISAEIITETTTTTVAANDDRYVYKYNSTIHGASGTNVEVEVIPTTLSETSFLLKSRETYRIAVEFYNQYGQFTEPKWICDIIVPDGNLDGNINTLKVTFKNLSVLRSFGVVGWNILRVERTDQDKTIITQGVINPCIFQDYDLNIPNSDNVPTQKTYDDLGKAKAERTGDYSTAKYLKMPSPFMRNASDIIEDPIVTQTVVNPWPANVLFNGYKGTSGSPRISGVRNGKCISYPVMGGDVTGDIAFKGIDVINKFAQHPNYPYAEVYKKNVKDKVTAQETYQFTNMFQLYSPELIFLNPIFGSELKYTVIGKLVNGSPRAILGTNPTQYYRDSKGNLLYFVDKNCGVWGKQIATADDTYKVSQVNWTDNSPDFKGNVIEDVGEVFKWVGELGSDAVQALFEERSKVVLKVGDVISDVRVPNHLHLFNVAEKRAGIETYSSLHKEGFIGPAGGRSRRQNLYQYYRNYLLDRTYNITHSYREIAGNPIIIGKGESTKIYNDNTLSSDQYTFNNHLFTLVSDSNTADPQDTEDPILCVNSVGANCLNIVDKNETALEDILSTYSITGNSTALVEVKRHLDNQYGGNTYEARSRNAYLRIGKYTTVPSGVSSASTTIIKAGDIFVNRFKFLRILPNVAQVQNHRYTAITEIVEFPVESSINSDCRNDRSLNSWDDVWMPSFDDYHNYNRVYSQEAISNKNIATPFTFEQVKHSAVRILSSKIKVAGEIVDGWTDVLINEEQSLNGQYGKLTKLIRNNDTLFFFQDNAFGILQVQPRVAIQANDGIGVELGTGQILYNYQYLSTASGSTNPRCIFASPNFVYYIDVTNRTLNRTSGQPPEGLTDPAGLHVFMYKNLLQSYDNSLAVIGVYDNINDEAYFTTPGFTIVFNESINSFVSFYDFKPKFYIKTPGRLFSCNDAKSIYEHFLGDYGNFYGTVYDSSITFLMNPRYNESKVFNNLNFKTELYDENDVDMYSTDGFSFVLPLKSIKVWNEYQDSGTVDLIYNTNISRKFRDWNLWMPRS